MFSARRVRSGTSCRSSWEIDERQRGGTQWAADWEGASRDEAVQGRLHRSIAPGKPQVTEVAARAVGLEAHQAKGGASPGTRSRTAGE